MRQPLKSLLLKWTYWILFSTLPYYTSMKYLPLNADEGVVLSGARHLLAGKQLYTEMWQIVPPGSFYLIATLWKIVGVSYFTAKLFSI